MGETACSGSSFAQLGAIIFVLSRFLKYAGWLAGPPRGQHPYTPYVEIQRDLLNPSQDVFFLGKSKKNLATIYFFHEFRFQLI